MKISRNPDIERTLVGFIGLFPKLFAGFQIIIDGFVKGFFKLFYGSAFEVDEVIDSQNFTIEYVILRTEME